MRNSGTFGRSHPNAVDSKPIVAESVPNLAEIGQASAESARFWSASPKHMWNSDKIRSKSLNKLRTSNKIGPKSAKFGGMRAESGSNSHEIAQRWPIHKQRLSEIEPHLVNIAKSWPKYGHVWAELGKIGRMGQVEDDVPSKGGPSN